MTRNETAAEGGHSRFVTTLYFDWTRPPLTANQRMHWRQRAAITRDIREATALKARRLPELGTCSVTLTWVVNDRRRRDADNLVPTLKAMCDGLVDAGVTRDDTPELMHKIMPIIRYENGATARLELEISNDHPRRSQ